MATFDELSTLERERALKLHPAEEWAGMTPQKMFSELADESIELLRALNIMDVNGPHGILAESVQVAGVARRIFEEITRRELEGKA